MKIEKNGQAILQPNRGLLTELATSINIQTFTTDGTWTKPAGAIWCEIIAIGGGGGGGSGRCSADSQGLNCGGGGGGAGGYIRTVLKAANLGATEAVVIGTGGAGAPAYDSVGVATDGVDGSNGNATTFGAFISAAGGSGGKKGTNTTGDGGLNGVVIVRGVTYYVGARGGSYGSGPSNAAFFPIPTGGGQGGHEISARFGGGDGGAIATVQYGLSTTSMAGGVAGTSGTPAGGNGNAAPAGWPIGGSGGGGAYATRASGQQAGGNGALYGGGGGGGQAGVTDEPHTSSYGGVGKAGDGANGILMVITYLL